MVTELIVDYSVTHEGSSTQDGQRVYGLRFTYRIGGQEYSGTSSTKSTLNEKYKVGDEMIVAYNPDKYAESDQYETYYAYLHLALLIPGLVFLAIGIIGFRT